VIDAGYFFKRIELSPDWLAAPAVSEICSVSHCISQPPDGWIDAWRHNEFGWFNRIADAIGVVPAERRAQHRLFAYRIHPEIFRTSGRAPLLVPADVRPEAIPRDFRSLGFDSVSRSSADALGFECSPLSCNALAAECGANEFCLFPSIGTAIVGAERFALEQPEPGDYYVVEVLEGPTSP
jgi:hypothetical protein